MAPFFCLVTMIEKKKAIVLVALAIAVVGIVLFAVIVSISANNKKRIAARRERILMHTDHSALLAASRLLLARKQSGAARQASTELRYPDPNDPTMPEAIRDAGVEYIVVEDNSVRLELGGGFVHFGLVALPDGSSAEISGCKVLVPGLCYYEEQ
jgi:hypothetical protein